jgi:hypothetical protein
VIRIEFPGSSQTSYPKPALGGQEPNRKAPRRIPYSALISLTWIVSVAASKVLVICTLFAPT